MTSLGIGVLLAATLLAPAPNLPPAVSAACDFARSVAAATPGVSIRRSTGTFGDETLQHPVPACRLLISGSFKRAGTGPDASIRLRNAFEGRGWMELGEFSADGTDGTSFAFRNQSVGCLVRGRWNGGADGDPEIPPEDWYKVSVLCMSPPPSRAPY